MEEKDLKTGEIPEGIDQPEPDSEEDGQKETPEEDISEESSEDEVKISKSELERLQKDASEKENYRKAVIRLNKSKGRSLPQSEPEQKLEPKDDYEEPKEEFVTRKELVQRENKQVISEACKNPEIDENWDEIIVYYIPPREDTYEAKIEAITKAHKFWSLDRKSNEVPKTEDKGKKAAAELAADTGTRTGKEKLPETPKKSVMPKRQKMENWYD